MKFKYVFLFTYKKDQIYRNLAIFLKNLSLLVIDILTNHCISEFKKKTWEKIPLKKYNLFMDKVFLFLVVSFVISII
jgi:hypothetical protein